MISKRPYTATSEAGDCGPLWRKRSIASFFCGREENSAGSLTLVDGNLAEKACTKKKTRLAVSKSMSNTNTVNFNLDNIYTLSEALLVKPSRSSPHLSSKKKTFPQVIFTAKVERKYEFYVWNVVLPMFVFVVMCFTCFCLPREDLSDRFFVVLTMVLTTAAYKSAVASMLPTLSYLTLLDKYVLSSWGFIALFVAAISGIANQSDGVELAVALIMVAIYFGAHIYFVRKVYSLREDQKKIMNGFEGKIEHATNKEKKRQSSKKMQKGTKNDTA